MEHQELGVRYWTADQLTFLTDAVQSAAAGEPTMLVVEGEPGMGKTGCLDLVDSQARDFAVLTAEAVESVTEPYFILQQWGVLIAPAADEALLPAFHAAQLLRDVLDARPDQPVLLRIDDAQWADRESLEALSWLMRRAEGDRLLVTLGHRPLRAADRSDWQRWLRRMPGVRVLQLAGLTLIDATALAAELQPSLDRDAVRMLWEHTDGNPLYLSTLLVEYDASTLARMRTLPAPAEFARTVALRLDEVPEATLTIARAMAVLNLGWISLPELSAVSNVQNPAQSIEALAGTGLIELDVSGVQVAARFTHALIRAAVYQQTPLQQRQALHLIAATVAHQTSQSLEHRMAATDQYDRELATDMDEFAAELIDRESYRLAAQFLGWASDVTFDRGERSRRRLESLLFSVLARDLGTVHAAEGELRTSSDPARSALVLAALATAESRFDEVVADLTTAARDTPAGDPKTAYRSLSLLGWAQVITGSDHHALGATLDALHGLGVDDRPFRVFRLLAGGELQLRLGSPESALAHVTQLLPGRPVEATRDQSSLLTWRGVLRVHTGFLSAGIADLQEAHRRMLQSGSADPVNGGTPGFLGQAYWFNGQWDLARICFQLAVDMAADEQLLPLVLAYLPLDASSSGNFEAADSQLAEAEASLSRVRWLEGIHAYMTTRVVRAHAGGKASEQRALWADLKHDWPELQLDSGVGGAIWLLHAVLALIWGSSLDEAMALLQRMEALSPQAQWVPAVVTWLTGLVAEQRHQPVVALRQLRAADDSQLRDLPLYRAHLLADRGRLEHDAGHRHERDAALNAASSLYASLGAVPYVERFAHARDTAGAPVQHAWRPNLTDRERDILTLLLRGMSYAQISKELFITNSTVSYHLTNIYNKAGVRSRHQLTEVVRGDLQLFGIPHVAGLR